MFPGSRGVDSGGRSAGRGEESGAFAIAGSTVHKMVKKPTAKAEPKSRMICLLCVCGILARIPGLEKPRAGRGFFVYLTGQAVGAKTVFGEPGIATRPKGIDPVAIDPVANVASPGIGNTGLGNNSESCCCDRFLLGGKHVVCLRAMTPLHAARSNGQAGWSCKRLTLTAPRNLAFDLVGLALGLGRLSPDRAAFATATRGALQGRAIQRQQL